MLQSLLPVAQHLHPFITALPVLDGQYVLMLGGAISLLYLNGRADAKSIVEERQKGIDVITAAIDTLKKTKEQEILREQNDRDSREQLARLHTELAETRRIQERILAYIEARNDRASAG